MPCRINPASDSINFNVIPFEKEAEGKAGCVFFLFFFRSLDILAMCEQLMLSTASTHHECFSKDEAQLDASVLLNNLHRKHFFGLLTGQVYRECELVFDEMISPFCLIFFMIFNSLKLLHSQNKRGESWWFWFHQDFDTLWSGSQRSRGISKS